MMFSQRFVVRFDDGTEVEAQASSRDMVALERDGVDLSEIPPVKGSYILAHAALARMKRLGKTDIEVPDTWEALADLADLEPVDADVADPEGNGSGQEATTG